MKIDWIKYNVCAYSDGGLTFDIAFVGKRLSALQVKDPIITDIKEVLHRGCTIHYEIYFEDNSMLKLFNPAEVHLVV